MSMHPSCSGRRHLVDQPKPTFVPTNLIPWPVVAATSHAGPERVACNWARTRSVVVKAKEEGRGDENARERDRPSRRRQGNSSMVKCIIHDTCKERKWMDVLMPEPRGRQ